MFASAYQNKHNYVKHSLNMPSYRKKELEQELAKYFPKSADRASPPVTTMDDAREKESA